MKKLKLYSIIVVLAIISISLKAQDYKSFKIDPLNINLAVYPIGNNGILILEKLKHDKKNIDLKVTFLDKSFEIKWTKTFNNGDFNLDRISPSEDKKKVTLAFFTKGKKIFYSHRVLYNDYVRLVSMNLENGDYEKMESEIKDNATLKEFGSTKELIYGIFSDKNMFKSRMYVLAYSIPNKKNYTIKLGEGTKHTIDFIASYHNDDEASLYTMFSYKDNDNVCCQIDEINGEGGISKVSKKALSDEKE